MTRFGIFLKLKAKEIGIFVLVIIGFLLVVTPFIYGVEWVEKHGFVWSTVWYINIIISIGALEVLAIGVGAVVGLCVGTVCWIRDNWKEAGRLVNERLSKDS